MTESGWFVPLVVIAVGVVLGFILLHLTRPRGSPPSAAAPSGSPAPEQMPVAPVAAAAASTSNERAPLLSPQVVGALKGGAVVALAFVLYLALRDGSAPRSEGMGMTGGPGVPQSPRAAAPETTPAAPPDHASDTSPERPAPSLAPIPSAQLDAARAFAAQHPDSRDAKVALGWALVDAKGWIEVYHLVEELIAARADDPDALALAATVQLAMGQRERAAELLDQVLAAQPDHPQARQWRARVDQPTTPASPRSDPPAAGEGDPGAGLRGPNGDALRGTVKLATGAVAPPGATLFIIVRAAGTTAGPPLATRKITTPSFPRAFTVGPEDVMVQGVTLTGALTLEARLDSDGDARTRDPSDLFAAWPDPVEPGARGLVLELAPGPR